MLDAPCPDGGAGLAVPRQAGRQVVFSALSDAAGDTCGSRAEYRSASMGLQATSRQDQSSTLNHPVLLAFTVSPEGE